MYPFFAACETDDDCNTQRSECRVDEEDGVLKCLCQPLYEPQSDSSTECASTWEHYSTEVLFFEFFVQLLF